MKPSYVDHLRAGGLNIAHVSGMGVDSASVSETLDAMRSGAPVIVQGALQVGQWSGRADVLRRVETPEQAWALVLRGHRHEACAGDQGQYGPASQPVFRPAWIAAGAGPGICLCGSARDRL